MRFSLVLLCCLAPLAALADDVQGTASPSSGGVVTEVSKYLQVQSILIGPAYSQGTFKMHNGSTSTQLTDNGRVTAILDYTSKERVLGRANLKYGEAVLGLNFTGSVGRIDTKYQNGVPGSSAIVGQNVGSRVTGEYLMGMPLAYLRLAPVYSGSETYWLFGYGLGGALWRFSGNPIFYTNSGGGVSATSMPVTSGTVVSLAQIFRWQFHWGHWDAVFTGKYIGASKVEGFSTTYEEYGLGLAYNIRF